ncbi:NAD-dependent epimerase/dehydratase family protein [Glutamicibacter sp. MCAF14]|uniref:NAD-dependent epimerase/dehydratase family protein n=1 Tax=Glutamicibacter sp. MCAF14 TaxID=3233043 RepID=UPI003F8E656F
MIELSYEPAFVEEALAALSAHAAHWTLVSTVSVYANQQQPAANEDAAVHEPKDMGDYGQAKVAAERTSERVLGERLLIARPGLITGPKDPTDRFSYWVSRLALAGAAQVLIPAVQGRYVQVIDVRDVAAWIIDAGQRELQGVVNVVGTPRPLADVLDTAAQVVGFTGELVAAEDQWLQEHQVSYWSGERSLPLWLPREDFGFLQRGNRRYKSAAGPERDMTDLLADILADERARALDRERRAGLDRGQELELLAELARRG